jgi:hypothetical protein
MKKILALNTAVNISLAIYSIMILFHLTVIAGIIPYKYTWGGKLESYEAAVMMESISIFITLLAIILTLIRVERLKINSLKSASKIAIWLLVCLFALNTVGNLLAEQNLETYIATPVTLFLTILNLRIAIS